MKQKNNALVTVPNNEVGRIIIKEVKALAKRNGWKVTLRGRHSDRKSVAKQIAGPGNQYQYIHSSLRRSIPQKYSERFAVYVLDQFKDYITPAELTKLEAQGRVK